MPDWLIAAIVAAVPGVLAAGGLWVRVGHLEKEIGKCVTREVYALQQNAMTDKLNRIENIVERLYDRLTGYARTPKSGDTDPGNR